LVLTQNNTRIYYGYMTLYPNKQIHVKSEDVQSVFQKHNICPSNPIDYTKFVEDIHNITAVTYTQVFDTRSIPQYSFTNNENGTRVIS